MKRGIICIIVVCIVSLSLQPAQALLITIEIQAVVDSVRDEGNYLEGKIKPGDSITGFYIYESTTPDSNPSQIGGRYGHTTPPTVCFSVSEGSISKRTLQTSIFLLKSLTTTLQMMITFC